jgi:hypothetical protein
VMEPERKATTVGGGVVKDLTAGGTAAAFVTLGLWHYKIAPPPEIVLAMQLIATVVLGFVRRLVESRNVFTRLARVMFKRWLKQHDIPVEDVLDATVRIDPPPKEE